MSYKRAEYRPTDWNLIGQYKQKARALATEVEPRLQREEISWDELKEICSMNTTLWKLLLKEFRSRGYDIGSYKKQFLAKK
ncbi:MAG: hypothetical protein FJ358_02020 [Thaumarchaeota archaeon]|nr:hypothetical protein [Nitrososphaerota archaeon]